MKLFLSVMTNDLKLIFRDKSLFVMFIVPVAMIAICRFGIPPLTGLFPVLSNYHRLIVATLTTVTAATPSYLIGFVMLDERDENVHTIYRVLPLPGGYILRCRIVFMIIAGFVFSLLVLALNGVTTQGSLATLLSAFLFSLVPPVLTFTMVSFAHNKIEAATFYKGLNMALILPVVSFFVGGIWGWFFGIIPFFWTFKAFMAVAEPGLFALYFVVSAIFHFVLMIILFKVYQRRAD
jgi:fluoroquinolone transport system permease protein